MEEGASVSHYRLTPALVGLDTMTEILSFLHPKEILPAAMTSKNFLSAGRRLVKGPIESDPAFFCFSPEMAEWAVVTMACPLELLCIQAAKHCEISMIQWAQSFVTTSGIFTFIKYHSAHLILPHHNCQLV